MQITRPLSEHLQAEFLDIQSAMDSVSDCRTVLQTYRNDCDHFERIYNSACTLHGEPEIEMPRTAGRQTHRSNAPASSSIDHFRVNTYLPFLDAILQQIDERFSIHAKAIGQLSMLLPNNFLAKEMPIDCFKIYEPLLHFTFPALEAELMRWRSYWKRRYDNSYIMPKTIADAASEASKLGTYPAITTLLHIFATLPVTTCTGERSFSSLKLLKTYLRSTMSQERLNGLSHLYIHKHIVLDYDAVVDIFSKNNRRLAFR